MLHCEIHSLVVTSPAPESTTRLEPEVVTPKAANAKGIKVNKEKTRKTDISKVGHHNPTKESLYEQLKEAEDQLQKRSIH